MQDCTATVDDKPGSTKTSCSSTSASDALLDAQLWKAVGVFNTRVAALYNIACCAADAPRHDAARTAGDVQRPLGRAGAERQAGSGAHKATAGNSGPPSAVMVYASRVSRTYSRRRRCARESARARLRVCCARERPRAHGASRPASARPAPNMPARCNANFNANFQSEFFLKGFSEDRHFRIIFASFLACHFPQCSVAK